MGAGRGCPGRFAEGGWQARWGVEECKSQVMEDSCRANALCWQQSSNCNDASPRACAAWRHAAPCRAGMHGGLVGARQMFGKGSWLDWLVPTLLSTHPPNWKRVRALEARPLNLPQW